MAFTDDSSIQELLTPSSCYSPQAIKAFLRKSRKVSDDNLPNKLPRTGSCAEHISTVLFPAWHTRDTILTYCEDVANSSGKPGNARSASNAAIDEDSSRTRQHPIDPRMDPYGARDSHRRRSDNEAQERIMTWVRNERNIENIIRETSCELLASKCGTLSTPPKAYISAYENFDGEL